MSSSKSKRASGGRDNRVTIDVNLNHSEAAYRVSDYRRVTQAGAILNKKQRALCSQDAPMETERDQWKNHENVPEEIRERIALARRWGTTGNQLLQNILEIQLAYYNSKWNFEAVDASDAKAVNEWKLENRILLRRVLKETWEDRLATRNVVIFWREATGLKIAQANKTKLLTIPAERCRYKDAMGHERLWVKLDWTREDFKGDVYGRDRYGAGREVELLEKEGEHFRVLKDARVGWGFAEPTIYSLFRTLAQEESLQVADNLWAYISRAVIRQFKLGHEIRQGPFAGSSQYMWTPERDEATRELFEGRWGCIDASTNFDVDIQFPYPDGKRFDVARYASVWQRIRDWAGPVGLLLECLARGQLNEAVLDMFREVAHDERDDVGPFIEDIVNEVLYPPAPVKLTWSDECFTSARARLEMRKLLLASGPMSPQTALIENGLDPETEARNKIDWAKKPKEVRLPGYDAAHGNNPQTDAGGRPAGVKDLGSRAALNGDSGS